MTMKYSKTLIDISIISLTKKTTNFFRNCNTKELLMSETCFLPEHTDTWARLWYIRNDKHNQVKCPSCNNVSNLKKVKNVITIRHCSRKCSMSQIDPETMLTKNQLSGLKSVKTMISKIDPDTGLTIMESKTIKRMSTMSQVDPETGSTKNQLSGLKSMKTMISKIDPETGLTIMESKTIKRMATMSQIDHGTGLSGFQNSGLKTSSGLLDVQSSGLTRAQEIGLKTSNTLNTVQSSGLTRAQEIGLKSKETLSKVDPETGLTGYQEIGLKSKETLSKVDPETGLTGRMSNTIKAKETMSIVDPETGLTGYQRLGINSKLGNSKIDLETGLTGYQVSGMKSKETMSKVDPATGMSIHKTRGLNAKETMSRIDPATGMSIHQTRGLNARETLSKIDSVTGMTGYQKIGIKMGITSCITGYSSRLLDFHNEYKLLTTQDEYINSRLLKYSCDRCDSVRESYWPYIRCLECYPYNRSIGENEVLEYCKSLESSVISGDRRLIKPLELDIYIPEYNLAIEYNGIYWHSSDSVSTESKDYHLHKTELCASKDIQLFHIFENEWLDDKKQEIWKSIIRNKLGLSQRIFARKSIVTKITSKDTKEFLNSNHLQGTCVSSVNLGLTLDDELVAIMTFGRSRYDKGVEWELLRYCGKLNTSVVGGAGKLLAQFRRENSGSIISYADKRRSNGNLYEKLGFELSHESAPNYWYYIDPMILESRVKYQKHKLRDKLEIFDGNLSESENMYMNGYRKIFDCGNQVWKIK